nr:MAG TPA: hypothetical protein [Caudoviricetes sp.]
MSSITQLFVSDMGNMSIPAPPWINLPIDEQIQYQVKETLEKHPDRKVIMCFTYDENRHPRMQKQVVEI